jgi:hypothetical protein
MHAYWGALFIRLFGFSFNCVRFSTIPFALGAVGLCYLLVRRAGLQAPAAVFVTLLFGLSPLFLPLSVSFMTDVPSLFFMFASFYALFRAARESVDVRGYGWLALGVAMGFIGGTARQVVWLVPLIVLPYLAWVRRKTWVGFTSIMTWVFVLTATAGVMGWFNRQPYAIPQPTMISELALAIKSPSWELNAMARLLLMLLLMSLPAAIPLVLRASLEIWRGTRALKIAVALLFLGLTITLLIHPSYASIPWVSNTLNWEGINGSAPLPGRPIVLTRPIRALAAVGVYVASLILLVKLANTRGLPRRAFNLVVKPSDDQFALAAVSLFSIAYLALVVLRSVHFDVFDRYLLPILPWTATGLLIWFESEDRDRPLMKRAMPVAWALLAVLALYAITSTRDFWALARARVSATRELEAAGVPRTAIDGGFEYNAWTELTFNGRINSRWVVNPPGAYRPTLSQTPSVVPVYRLEYAPTSETTPSEFGSVGYFSFLPPFHKRVSIDRLLGH